MTDTRLRHYILKDHADSCQLPWVLVHGIIEVESAGNPLAWRAEPHYRWFWDCGDNCPFRTVSDDEVQTASAPADFEYYPYISSQDTEWCGQQASWGPMQIMGAVARERGFDEGFIQLCSDDEGIYWGCRHLQHLAGQYLDSDGWPGVVSAYNQGSPRRNDDGTFCNQSYVDKVLAEYRAIVASTQLELDHASAA